MACAALRQEGPAARAVRAHPGRRRADRGAARRQRRVRHLHGAGEEHRRSVPVDVGRIEVYGYTGTAAPPPEPLPRGGDARRRRSRSSPPPTPDAAAAGSPRPTQETPLPGGPATIVESLTPDDARARSRFRRCRATGRRRRRHAVAGPRGADAGPLRRFYIAMAFSPRGRPGPPGAVAELRLTHAARCRRATCRRPIVADAVSLEWEPSGGLVGLPARPRACRSSRSPLDDRRAAASAARPRRRPAAAAGPDALQRLPRARAAIRSRCRAEPPAAPPWQRRAAGAGQPRAARRR